MRKAGMRSGKSQISIATDELDQWKSAFDHFGTAICRRIVIPDYF
jgi:hypothetical protein